MVPHSGGGSGSLPHYDKNPLAPLAISISTCIVSLSQQLDLTPPMLTEPSSTSSPYMSWISPASLSRMEAHTQRRSYGMRDDLKHAQGCDVKDHNHNQLMEQQPG